MRSHGPSSSIRLWLAVSLVLLGLTQASSAATVCDTDPNRVPFLATVDPTSLNKFLDRVGDKPIHTPDVSLTLPGLCVDHQIPISTGIVSLPLADAAFAVTPAVGSIRVDLDLPGTFEVGIDGGRYRAVNCDSSCVLDLPYLGEVFNGCAIESSIIRPILGALNANVSWDDIHITQIADTCVLGDCTAVHPLESSRVTLTNFDVDLTGFGSCNVCLDFPDPFPDPPCIDLCDGIDPLIESLLRPELEGALNGGFIKANGDGVLIDVFSRQIVKDFGCIDIPEVKDCKGRTDQPAGQDGLLRGPKDHGLNALFYSLPLGMAGVLALRLRRRSGSKAPRA